MARPVAMTLGEIEQAAVAGRGVVRETLVLTARSLSELAGTQLLLKAENLQRTGSFKIRGAASKLATLPEGQRRAGVVAASAGNHAQGVALASGQAGVPCCVVMPAQASLTKIAATRAYGAEVVLHGANFSEAERHARAIAEERGRAFIPAFDDRAVIAGQGVVGLELCRQAAGFDQVLVPVGGGGLIAGVATAVKALQPSVKVIGVQVEAAPAAARSFASGRRARTVPLPTIADGVAVGQPGRLSFQVMSRLVDEVVTVTDTDVAWAIALLLERAKLLVEGAGALGLAALLNGVVRGEGKTSAVVLSGGNIDPVLLGRVLDHGLARQGRVATLTVCLQDAPARLSEMLDVVAAAGANVADVTHQRQGPGIPLGHVRAEIVAETADAEHAERLRTRLRSAGFDLIAS